MKIEQLDEKQRSLCAVFQLEAEDVEDINVREKGETLFVELTLIPRYEPCPSCGCKDPPPKVNKYVTKRIRHSALSGRECIVIYHARRYECRCCGHTYYEKNPLTFKKQKISVLTVNNVLEDLKDPAVTFTSTAERNHISPTSAASIFDTHVNIPRQKLPEYLDIDEVYSFRHKELDSKYVCVLYDFTGKTPVDLLPSRQKRCLRSFFESIPQAERDNVKLVCSDMWEDYRWASRTFLRHACHAVDRFHISKEINDQADRVRRRLMKNCPRRNPDGHGKNPDYYLYKTWNWVLWRRDDETDDAGHLLFATNAPGKYNSVLKETLNYYQIREKLLSLSPELKEAWELKESLIRFYEENTRKTAEKQFPEPIRKFRNSSVPEMNSFGVTLTSWRNEILNSFDIVDACYEIDPATGEVSTQGVRPTTGPLERRNGLLKKASCGYTNWERFRNRGLYILMPDTDERITSMEAARRSDQKRREQYLQAAEKRREEIEEYNKALTENAIGKKKENKPVPAESREEVPVSNAVSYSHDGGKHV